MGARKSGIVALILSLVILFNFQSCGTGDFVANGNGDPYEGINFDPPSDLVDDPTDPNSGNQPLDPQGQRDLPLQVSYDCEFASSEFSKMQLGRVMNRDQAHLIDSKGTLLKYPWQPADVTNDIYQTTSQNILIEFFTFDSSSLKLSLHYMTVNSERIVLTSQCSEGGPAKLAN